jgi:DNA-binding MarR family transcriptional regulator
MPAFLMDRCAQAGNAYLNQVLSPFGLSAGQYGVLSVVAMLGPIDHSRLRRALGIDRTSVSVIVPVLQARGLITSGSDVLDRRRFILRCGSAGLDLLKRVRPVMQTLGTRIFAGLAADVVECLCVLLARRLKRRNNPFAPL